MDPNTASRLEKLNIRVMAETASHWLLMRDPCLALVERSAEGFGSIGSTGMMTERGLAFLVWRGGQFYLAAKGSEIAAEPEQVETIQRFSESLQAALR